MRSLVSSVLPSRRSVGVEETGHDLGGRPVAGGNEVRVGAQGHGRVLPEAAGDGHDIDAGGEELGGRVVAEVVEADLPSEAVA